MGPRLKMFSSSSISSTGADVEVGLFFVVVSSVLLIAK